MKVGFREAHSLTALLSTYFPSDLEYSQFQAALAVSPEQGRVIPGTRGLRKVRWHDPRRGKGRRSGLRIIYIWVPEASMIGLLDVYDKNEAEDITPAERRQLSALAEEFRMSLLRVDKEPRT